MSELSELIEINRNIEKQNDEIIRLLKVIAGEDEYVILGEETGIAEVKDIDLTVDVGEVLFALDSNIFKLSVKNNETTVDNLVGDDDASEYNLQELVANESIKTSHAVGDATVIFGSEIKGKLSETLSTCVEYKIQKAMIPWDIMKELVYAPYSLPSLINLDFYKTEDELINRLFY